MNKFCKNYESRQIVQLPHLSKREIVHPFHRFLWIERSNS